MQELTKYEKFTSLSKTRLQGVIEALNALGNCSNRSAYEYTEEEVMVIFQTVREETIMAERKFQFEPKVATIGDSSSTTWKELAASLYKHGLDEIVFSRTQWGQNCIRFYVKDCPVWITCYSVNFADPSIREYGIFLSYRGMWDKRDKTQKLKLNDLPRINSLTELIKSNRSKLIQAFNPEDREYLNLAGDSEYEGLAWVARDAVGFGSDDEAMDWLSGLLDIYVHNVVPLIKQS